MRDDKDVVQNALFAAFEKHQYYNIKDLERITKQPVVSIMPRVVCNINMTFLYPTALFKRNTQRNLQLQCKESTQKYVGIKATI